MHQSSKAFENQRGDYHTKKHSGGPELPPVGASPGWPSYRCKNSCGFATPPDSDRNICPKCKAPLVRWVRYEVKGSSSPNSPTPSEKP